MSTDSFISNHAIGTALLNQKAAVKSDIWRQRTLWLVLALTVFRVIYQVALTPYELTADEAHYWEWSRRPALSYYSKGPGVAWTNILTTHLLGDGAWAIRLPAAIASAIAMIALAVLTKKMTNSSRAGFLAAALFALCPAFEAVALVMTTDGPYVTCWALAMWAGWNVFSKSSKNDGKTSFSWAACLALSAALSIGFLYKYTIMLLPLGMIGFVIFNAKKNRDAATRLRAADALKIGVSLLLMVILISPVFIWNAQNDWPSLRHLLGFLKIAGGDYAPAPTRLSLYWTLHFFITQLGVAGPALILLMLLSLATRRRESSSTPSPQLEHDADAPDFSQARAYLIWCAAPILCFYGIISFAREIEGNWPIAGYLPLIVIVAERLVFELSHYENLLRDWQQNPAKPWRGFLRRKPETLFQILWHWTVGIGIVVGLGLFWINIAAKLPVVGKIIPVHRITGFHEQAMVLQKLIDRVEKEQHQKPIIIVSHYGNASHLAYYLPGKPIVLCATHYMGGRKSSYDFFADTDLKSPEFQGKPAILVGTERENWRKFLAFDAIESTDIFCRGVPVQIGLGYRGPVKKVSQSPVER